jgi:hypothetical protein
MHHRNRWANLVLVLGPLLLPPAAQAMNLLHYDLDSLVYMSTDIVIATLSVDSKQRFTATVTDTLYGMVGAGETLDTLSDFLGFCERSWKTIR